MNRAQQVLEKIKLMLLEMGFVETTVTNSYRSEKNFVCKNLYCIPQYAESLGFLIEYADSFEDAQKHRHEDGASFPLAMGVDEILTGLEKEIRQNMGG